MTETICAVLEEKVREFWDKTLFVSSEKDKAGVVTYHKKSYGEFWHDVEGLAASLVYLNAEMGDKAYSLIEPKLPNLEKAMAWDLALSYAGLVHVPNEYGEACAREVSTICDETKPRFAVVQNAEALEMLETNSEGIERVFVFDDAHVDTGSVDSDARLLSFDSLVDFGKGLLAENPKYLDDRIRDVAACDDDLNSIIYTINGMASEKAFPGVGVLTNNKSLNWLIRTVPKEFGVEAGDFLYCTLPTSHVFGKMVCYAAMYSGMTIINSGKPNHFKGFEKKPGAKLFFPGVPISWELVLREIKSKANGERGLLSRVLKASERILKTPTINSALASGKKYIEMKDWMGRRTFDVHTGSPSNLIEPYFITLSRLASDSLVLGRIRERFWDSEVRFIGGAAKVDIDRVNLLRAIFGENCYYELYGLTACPAVTVHKPDNYKSGSTGVRLAGTDLAIVKFNEEGIVRQDKGDIIVSGPQVCQSYLGYEGGFVDFEGKKWLVTGDTGHLEGDHLVIGYPKHFVKYKDGRNRDMSALCADVQERFGLDYVFCLASGQKDYSIVCGREEWGRGQMRLSQIGVIRYLRGLRNEWGRHKVPKKVRMVSGPLPDGIMGEYGIDLAEAHRVFGE